MRFPLLSVIYLVITSSIAAIPCPPFLESETIALQDTNTVFEPNCDAGDANICIAADAGLPLETVEGWKYINPGDNLDGRGNKINWYFQASWFEPPTPDILLPSPSDITPSLTVGCLNELSFTVKGKMQSIFIIVYTKPKNDGNDIAWYRSRLLISPTTLNTFNAEFTTFTTITASQLNEPINTAYSLPLQDNTNNGVSNSKAANLQEILDNEEILAISLQTNSGKQGDGTYSIGLGENDFVISEFIVKYDKGCTCPMTRILDLMRSICTKTGDECMSQCKCCEGTDVCRTISDDPHPTCQQCLEIGSDSLQCQSTSECCNGHKDNGVVCGIDGICCITHNFGSCSNNNHCCGELQCKNGKCMRCIDIPAGEPCQASSDCCNYDGNSGIICSANQRCCKSKGFECTIDSECCDGLICNDDGKCDFEECKKLDVDKTSHDICSSSSECCGIDTIGGIICGKEYKCCIVDTFPCQYNYQCCDDLICNSDKKCVHPQYDYGRDHQHHIHYSKHYAMQFESVNHHMDDLDVLPYVETKDNSIRRKYRYLYVMVGTIMILVF